MATPDERDATRREVWQLFDWAEGLFGGDSPVLWRERQAYAEALGQEGIAATAALRAAQLAPRNAWEHYAIGRNLMRSGKLEQAATEFDRALDLEPQSLWANFYKGRCAHQLKRFDEAVNAFSACIVLEPGSSNWYYHRARSQAASGRLDKALADYNHALKLQPGLANALLYRGILHFQAKRYPEAVQDLQDARDHGASATLVNYHLSLVHHARQDDAAARASLRQALQADPNYKEALEFQKQLKR